jgi:hypothetical protein
MKMTAAQRVLFARFAPLTREQSVGDDFIRFPDVCSMLFWDQPDDECNIEVVRQVETSNKNGKTIWGYESKWFDPTRERRDLMEHMASLGLVEI